WTWRLDAEWADARELPICARPYRLSGPGVWPRLGRNVKVDCVHNVLPDCCLSLGGCTGALDRADLAEVVEDSCSGPRPRHRHPARLRGFLEHLTAGGDRHKGDHDER